MAGFVAQRRGLVGRPRTNSGSIRAAAGMDDRRRAVEEQKFENCPALEGLREI